MLKPRLSEKYKFSLEKRTFCQLFLVVQYKNKFNAQNVKLQVHKMHKMTEYFLMLMAHIPTVPYHPTL